MTSNTEMLVVLQSMRILTAVPSRISRTIFFTRQVAGAPCLPVPLLEAHILAHGAAHEAHTAGVGA